MGMNRPLRVAGLMAILALLGSACGAAEPIAKEQGFHRASNDTRAFDAYGQTAAVVRKTIPLESVLGT